MMAAYRERLTCVAIAVLLLAAYAEAADAYLEILPSGESQTRAIGSSILLTCKPKVTNPNLVENMQWFDPQDRVIDPLNKNNGQSKPSMYTELHQDNSLSLFFNSLEEKQAGKYTCKGTYTRNIQMVKSVTIDTIVAITWENAPENQYPILGEDFPILCKVRARPSPSIDWLYNGELIKTNDRYIIETHFLMIKNVQESDDGIYTCRASVQRTGELKERAIRVEVHIKPTIEEISSPITITEGENENIECKAKGKPQPTISWIKSLTQQNLSNADRFRVDSVKGTLTILDVKREDEGEYQCIAQNHANIAKANIQVNVIIKPKIKEFENRTTVVDTVSKIQCVATGQPAPDIEFRKLSTGKRYSTGAQNQDDRINVEKKVLKDETVSTLTITKTLRSDDGLYECIARNKGGAAYKNGHLIVEFPPSFENMQNETIYSWHGKKKNLTCIANSIPNATIEWFWSSGLIQNNRNNPQFMIFGNGPVSKLQVEPIDRRCYAIYTCIAKNIHGQQQIQLELREAHNPIGLQQVRMSEMTATTIRFDLIVPVTPDIPIKTITVRYKEINDLITWQMAKNKTWSVGSLYVIEGLTPLMSYEFRFATGNEVGSSQYDKSHVETMPGRTVPNEPRIVTNPAENGYEMSQFNNMYQLNWLTPADNGEPIDKYVINYCVLNHKFSVLENTCKSVDINPGRTNHYLKNLLSDTFYRAELQAHNVIGFGKAGYVTFKTARGDPGVKVENQLISSTTIIAIALTTALVIFVIVDITCCCVRKSGFLHMAYERFRRKPVDEEDTKLGRDEKEPLKEEKKITPIIDSGLRRETSVTFDGKRSVSKTGFVGKDSAV